MFYFKGDILTGLEPPYNQQAVLILHGCNCFHTMGAGIAKRLRTAFPQVYEADVKQTQRGDRNKLGTYSLAEITPWLKVLNCYTQFRYGRDKQYVEYWAVEAVLRRIAEDFHRDWIIRMPKIGCSLAGGDWEIVRPIIATELSKFHNVTIFWI